jgi:hypothetical protein
MNLIPVRRSCEDGEVCPTLIYDTDTGDAVVQGYLDQAASAALSFHGCSTASARTPSAGKCRHEPADR